MINATFHWNGDEEFSRIKGAAWAGIQRATEYLWGHILDPVLNVPNSGVHVKRKRGKGSYTIYPNPSKPGEPPRKRTGWLQRHVRREYDQATLTSRVGLQMNAIYGLFLELGTRFMAPRPWLLATTKKLWDKLAVLVSEP